MTDFIKVNDLNGIVFGESWHLPASFYSEGRFINKKNQYVTENYPGTAYQLVLKRERFYSVFERICMITTGIFLNVITLGLCNFSKDCRHLFSHKRVIKIAVRCEKSNVIKTDLSAFKKVEEVKRPII